MMLIFIFKRVYMGWNSGMYVEHKIFKSAFLLDACINKEAITLLKYCISQNMPNVFNAKLPIKLAHDIFNCAGKFFYNRLVDFMCVSPIHCMILAHPNAIRYWREIMGPTKPPKAQFIAPDTVRGMYGLTDTRNSSHGSGMLAAATKT